MSRHGYRPAAELLRHWLRGGGSPGDPSFSGGVARQGFANFDAIVTGSIARRGLRAMGQAPQRDRETRHPKDAHAEQASHWFMLSHRSPSVERDRI